tara:strand:+ start:55 stop:480 length:426 start_codon:yes stop_codon:yes gene_type:complete
MEQFNTFILSPPKSWINISDENPDGPTTFIRKEWDENPGVLQMSVAQYLSGKQTNPNHKDLIKLSQEFDSENEFDLMGTNSGQCQYGKYGYAEFKNEEFPFVSVWHISNQKNIVFLTYISTEKQTVSNIDEVYGILKNIRN